MVFSIVIPVYNREHLIQETLESVLNQRFDDYEVIVVDDGSTDGTVSTLRSYEDQIHLIQQENQGPGAARNRGIETASGEYVAFLDSDDRWFPWTLSTYANVVEQSGEPSFVKGARASFVEEKELSQINKDPTRTAQYDDFFEAAEQGTYVSSGVSVAKRKALEQAGGFTTENINAEDHDLAFRLGTQPGFVEVHSPPLVAVRHHDERVTGDPEKTAKGFTYLLDQEEAGAYPGGSERQDERRYLLCQHIRSASLSLAQQGHTRTAFDLYRRTLPWQISLGRFKYVTGFPIFWGWQFLQGLYRHHDGQ